MKEENNINTCILNLNPCYDHWVILKNPTKIPNVVRGDEVVTLVDGKGLNIARVLSRVLGHNEYFCINILGGQVGTIIENECNRLGILTKNYWIEDSNRINTALVYEYENKMLMINEPGPMMKPHEIDGFMEFFKSYAEPDISLVISGSAPRGFENGSLLRLVEIARGAGCSLNIDIAGSWLTKIVTASPELLKINADELKVAFGIEKDDLKSMESFRRENSIKDLIITNGKNGSIWLSENERLQARSTKLFSDFSVGSGDSFFAGLLYGREMHMSNREALKMATACGAANTLHYGAAIFEYSDLEKVISDVAVSEVKI
ncbi:MAG TPA: ribokinase [Mesotoga infera]|uniref:Ribokinase n=1 Tax=Mesotoga infera TaxID=1236046 RepID=A0A7C1D0K1_9BACT|nr:ribokinase [Mesotoga infera]